MPASAAAILDRLEASGIRLGLDRLDRLLGGLGHPERRSPSVLIAGTNGKGSTSALLAAMATAAGYRTGLYTSPHLETVEERLRLDGRAVSAERLGDLLARVVAASDAETGGPPTYFEALTAAAFLWFAEERVEIAVLEVGLGGRLDATNLADPLLSLITPVSFDHQEYLGDTLAAIAREKAGILRPGRPALAWIEEAEPAAAVEAVAAEIGAELRFAPSEVRIEAIERQGRGQRILLSTPEGRYDLTIGLLGVHQAKNLGLAVRAAEVLRGAGFPRLDAGAVERGAAACRWPGRLEEIEIRDAGGHRRVLLDAAHNPGGALTLGAFLAEAPEITRKVDLLFGVLADKDARSILAPLAPHVRRFVFTTPASPRALDPARLADLLPDPPGSRAEVDVEPRPEAALDRALALGGETLVACGSIFLIGEIRRLLRERFGVPEPAA